MRDLLLSLLIPAGLIWGLFSASGSILVLNWIWFQRPYDFSMGLWNSTPLFMISLGIALSSNVLRGKFRPAFPPILLVFIALLIWVTLSMIYAYNVEIAWQVYRQYAPSMWVAPILLFGTIRDLNLLKWVFWVSAGGMGVNAIKTGASLAAQGGGHVTTQIDGFVGDNNGFGLVLCLVVPILLGLRATLPRVRLVRAMFFGALSLILMTIVFTKSRGAFVSLAIVLLLGSLLSERPVRNLSVLLLCTLLAYGLIPDSYFDRLNTISSLSEDESAMGRFENWDLAWEEALDSPILGVGPENHIAYNQAKSPDVQVRVAHSTYFQVLGEFGFPGLILYFAFVAISISNLIGALRLIKPLTDIFPDLIWVRDLSRWLTCGLVGYAFGSGLLNMFWIEFPWYAMFYGSMLKGLLKAELEDRQRERSKAT